MTSETNQKTFRLLSKGDQSWQRYRSMCNPCSLSAPDPDKSKTCLLMDLNLSPFCLWSLVIIMAQILEQSVHDYPPRSIKSWPAPRCLWKQTRWSVTVALFWHILWQKGVWWCMFCCHTRPPSCAANEKNVQDRTCAELQCVLLANWTFG